MLYREGVKIKPAFPPLVGQMISGREQDVPVLRLWPVDWVLNTTIAPPPLAMLWHPVFGGVGHNDIVVRGLEAVRKGDMRRWTTQKWLCDLLDYQRARDYFKPDCRVGELKSTMPPSPAPADPDNPFGSA